MIFASGIISSAYPSVSYRPDSALAVKTPPEDEPVSVAEMKAQINVTHDEDDALIALQLLAARVWVEAITGRSFITTEYTYKLDGFPYDGRNPWQYLEVLRYEIALPRAPVLAVSKLEYIDPDGELQELVLGTDWKADTDRVPGRLYPASGKTPPATIAEPGSVIVTFEAGADEPEEVLEPLKLAQKVYAAALYEVRAAVIEGGSLKCPPGAIGLEGIIAPWRIY
jgi:uncharacterized phiE125 gp8 family phage protein